MVGDTLKLGIVMQDTFEIYTDAAEGNRLEQFAKPKKNYTDDDINSVTRLLPTTLGNNEMADL
eukprot:6976479-Alexandrium_andersonii.AAC.1